MTTMAEKPATIVSGEAEHRCFVCDVAVTGKYYTLATCRTQKTKTRLIEKLGQLVGERYMVVISEDDIICHGCAILINTLDRLETEILSVRTVVLRFLEKKYALPEGELLNSQPNNASQPAQISTKSPFNAPSARSRMSSNSDSFMARKRRAALNDLAGEQENGLSDANTADEKNDPKANIWMQCDKCKYTTHYNAFMIHHIRQHVKKRNPKCDYCGEEVKEGGMCSKQCGSGTVANNSMTMDNVNGVPAIVMEPNSSGFQAKAQNKALRKYITDDGTEVIRYDESDTGEAETVEMIAAEINEFRAAASGNQTNDVLISTVDGAQTSSGVRDEVTVLPTLHEVPEQTTRTIIIDQNSQHLDLGKGENVTLDVAGMTQHLTEGNEGEQPTSICVMEMSQDNSLDQPTLLTVQKMEDEGNAVYVQVVEVGKGEGMEDGGNVAKQVLTLSEDGTVEMVEYMWDDVVGQDGTQQNISFG